MMVGQLLVLLISACLLPINFGFVAATGNSNRPDYCSVSRNIPMASTTTTTDDDVDDVDDFHQYAAAAVDLSNAHVSESGFLSIQRSVRDWDNKKRQSYLYQTHLTTQPEAIQPPILMDSSIQLRLPSPSGNKQLIVKKQEGGDDKKQQILEIWDRGALVRRIPVEKHGSIIQDATGFGVASWNPDTSCIVYVAERLSPKTQPFWGTTREEGIIAGGQHVLGQGTAEEWGEQYVSQSPLLDLYILHVGTGKMERIANVPSGVDDDDETSTLGGVALGQPVWHPSLPEIAYTGWDAGGLGQMPRRLGMVYCRNRPSGVYSSNVSNLIERLSSKNASSGEESEIEKDVGCKCWTEDFPYARSPQYIEKGALLFLANPNAFVSHEGCMGLYKAQKGEIECLVPVVNLPSGKGPTVSGMGFPGLFLHQLPARVSVGENHLVFYSTWGSVVRLLRLQLDTKKVQLIKLPNSDGEMISSHSILCQTPNSDLIVSETASNRPSRVWLLPNDDLTKDTSTEEESPITTDGAKLLMEFPSMAASAYSSVEPKREMPFDVQVVSLPTLDSALPPIQALVCLPREARNEKCGMIVIPHGGPHSCSVSAYAPGFAFLASHYVLVFPNYRGSTGFGQASLESLLTNIGTNDVEDVMALTKHVLEEFKNVIDESKIGICGGSHGGFLTAHCIGQYPDFFQAAVMRNPVTNIASMVTATDIPDWCHAEAFGKYDFSSFQGPRTREELAGLYDKSPIVHVSKVKTPTLIALGMKDLRVPPSQGLEYYHTLRSAGVETELLVYPEDNHALNKVATEADHWIHIKQWFDKHL